MSQATHSAKAKKVQTVTILREMNQYGALTVSLKDENATKHIVEYATDELESTLRELPSGSSIPLATEPIGTRGNAWRATSLPR